MDRVRVGLYLDCWTFFVLKARQNPFRGDFCPAPGQKEAAGTAPAAGWFDATTISWGLLTPARSNMHPLGKISSPPKLFFTLRISGLRVLPFPSSA
jgi:hypothetical protein